MTDRDPPAEVLEDARGLLCPIPVVKLGERIRTCEPGTVVVLLADDPMAEEDVRLWCASQGHELLEVIREAEFSRIRVKKTS